MQARVNESAVSWVEMVQGVVPLSVINEKRLLKY